MIKIGDKTYRNLEEQVQYLTNYHDVNQGLVQWGIRVVGQVLTEADLPNPNTYDGDYGNAYAVGTAPPYNFYIWTRAAIVGGSDYWFDFGKISIVGPQGPTPSISNNGQYIISTNPETGTVQNIISIEDITGKSTRWYTGFNVPAKNDSLYNPGDMFLVSVGSEAGNIYIYVQGSGFQFAGNIRGAQGIQGIQGPQGIQGTQGPQGEKGATGDVGGFINIWGIADSQSQLPLPSTLDNLTVAYLVGTQEPYDLWIQVGQSSDTAIWTNTGPFNAATAVTVNGSYQNVWDADTKVNKITINNGKIAYAALSNGEQGQVSISVNNYTAYPNTGKNTDGAVAGYVQNHWGAEKPDGDGVLLSNDPSKAYQVATKNYVDTTTANKNSTNIGAGNMQRLFGMKSDGTIGWYYAAGAAGMGFYTYFIPCYMPISHVPSTTHEQQLDGSVLFTGTPIHPYQCANKKYVDELNKLYKTVINLESTEGDQYIIYCNTHRDLSTDWSTLDELNEQYEGNLNFMLYEHIANDEGYISFIFGVENAINTSQGTLTIAAKVGTTGLNIIEFDKNSAIQITSTATT